MENKKFVVWIALIGFVLLLPNKAFAYGVETHAYLTDEIVNFYNQNYGNNSISGELKSYIIDGSRREDDAPRWLNHFYDPVNNRGLNDPEWGKGFSSKEWAQSDSKQTTYAYRPIKYVASILDASEQEAIDRMDLNFTWQQAIRYYRDGEIEKAMFTLGHVLHLIEDASVPDHTRNDGHPEIFGDGSPYEVFSERFTLASPDSGLPLRLTGKKPFDSMPTLSSYFNEMANYSNNNFYSEDTINKSYNLPKSTEYVIIGDVKFAMNVDEDGGVYKLSAEPANRSNLKDTEYEVTLSNDSVVAGYWSHLSVKSVQVGAGVIKLFFDDIERVNYGDSALVRDDRNPITKLIDNARAWAQIVSSFGKALTSSTSNVTREAWSNTFSNGGSDEELIEVIDTKKVNDVKKTESVGNNADSKNNDGQVGVEIVKNKKDLFVDEKETDGKIESPVKKKDDVLIDVKQQKETVAKKTIAKDCAFSVSQSPSHKDIILNEVAWMGGDSAFGLSSNDEWIELKNVSSQTVDISGWQILDQGEQIKTKFTDGTIIPAGGFYLLERTDDNSVPNATADLIYSGALSNTNEGLRLFNNQCNLIDEVLANPDWPAGNSTSKRTMEREANLSWHTFGGDASGGIWGTPKRANGQALVQSNVSGGGGGAPVNNQQPTTNNQQQSPAKILISEVQITGGTGKTENDFIELYNPNNFQVNLNGYRLVKRTKTGTTDTSIKSWTSDVYIPANEYYLWANSGYTDIPITPDITTTATISNDNGVAIRFGVADTGTIIDSVAWGEAQNTFIENLAFSTNPGVSQSIQRKFQNSTFVDTDNNASDFELQSCSSPKAQSKTCSTTSQAPSTLLPLEIIEVVYDIKGVDGAEESDEGKELITLSNPNDTEVDLNTYSVQYLGSSGDFSDIKKKNFEADNRIPVQGIFKIGTNCHTDTPCNDVGLSWSQALGNASGTVFLVYNQELISGISDPDIIDAFHYPTVTTLTAPDNFAVDYDSSRLEMAFSWGGNPELTYQIQEYNSPGVTIFEGKGNSFIKRIDEVGKTHKFSVRAFNENAEHTELIEKEISAASFIKTVHFYKAAHRYFGSEAEDNLVEISYDEYPFLPPDLTYTPNRAPGSNPNYTYKILVFYLNTEAPKRTYLNGTSPLEEDLGKVLKIEYDTCAGAKSFHDSLLLPDTLDQCNVGGGMGNSSVRWERYLPKEDFRLLLPAEANEGEPEFIANDYLTVAFYGFKMYFPQGYTSPNGIMENFELLAVDKTKYYFSESVPPHLAPEKPANLSFSFDESTSILTTSFDKAADADTWDSLLRYEISYDGGTNWELAPQLTNKKVVEPGTPCNVQLRTVDDFGLRSADVLSGVFTAPSLPIPLGLTNIKWGRINGGSEVEISFDYPGYPFIPDGNMFDMIVFYLNDLPPIWSNSASKVINDIPYPRLIISYAACIGSSDSSLLILYRSEPDQCFSWMEPHKSAIFPPPGGGSAGTMTFKVTGLDNADKGLNELSSNDYITIGFYRLVTGGGLGAVLTANDTHRYYFSE